MSESCWWYSSVVASQKSRLPFWCHYKCRKLRQNVNHNRFCHVLQKILGLLKPSQNIPQLFFCLELVLYPLQKSRPFWFLGLNNTILSRIFRRDEPFSVFLTSLLNYGLHSRVIFQCINTNFQKMFFAFLHWLHFCRSEMEKNQNIKHFSIASFNGRTSLTNFGRLLFAFDSQSKAVTDMQIEKTYSCL